MKIDTLFIAYIIGLVAYIQITPGTQMFPPLWKLDERMNWKPSLFFWINILIILSYFIFRTQ